ncbi:DNA polymerase III subunit delta [Alphaproteobacteria bacterium GH1-50]|uniref:DNA-directed DNA polymerase n=1 Tax=Kangsaoukella pontilimi TaxID=2691042 RepID=A0A7C9MXY5_9RHOB|nr:DNA polymerase III subunit delta [Kangsaoukella pontilimi]MXQ09440.1 DNA polymerase III subunit delta [Kangsaoukella pontilimi]
MKLSTRDAPAYFAKPDPSKAGLLIYGQDAMRVALRRQEVIKALVGPEGEEEMRLTRISAADLRKDGALLLDAIKAQGFFPGPRVAFVEDAGDGLSEVIGTALGDWQAGDAAIIVTAGQLAAKSKLRKLFEDAPHAYATGIYDDPPGRAEIEAALKSAGLERIPLDAMETLTALARDLDPGDFRQTLEKVALYKLGDETPLTPDEIALMAPASIEAGVDDVIAIAADGKAHEVGPVLRRLAAQGATPVSLCIAATRHFRTLHMVAADPGGPGAGIGKLRPPVFGPRRDRIQRQASHWGMVKLERALTLLLDTDLTLRSTATVPEMAVMERALLKLAWMGRR